MYFSVQLLFKMKIDDVVGAIPAHLVAGIWGTLAVGIFSTSHSFATQFIGVLSYGIFSTLSAFLIFYSIKVLMGVRVSEEEEIIGLDIAEHEMESYSGFQIFTVE